MKKNIAYQTDQLANYFGQNRISWQQFYASEREIISQLGLGVNHTILDIGCGCGGLGIALREKFGVDKYTGVEINPLAAASAQKLNSDAQILCGDFLDLHQRSLNNQKFDVVFSLSCFDWNIQFSEMLSAAWKHVSPGGHLVATFRLVVGEGCDDIKNSYQYINYDGDKIGECAAYVVLNVNDLMERLVALNPEDISAFGYFGAPSSTAVTPYEKLCFAAFSIKKKKMEDQHTISLNLSLPDEITSVIKPLV